MDQCDAARKKRYRQAGPGQLARSLPGFAEISAPVLVAVMGRPGRFRDGTRFKSYAASPRGPAKPGTPTARAKGRGRIHQRHGYPGRRVPRTSAPAAPDERGTRPLAGVELSGALTGEFYIGGSRLRGGEPVAGARLGDEQLRAIGALQLGS